MISGDDPCCGSADHAFRTCFRDRSHAHLLCHHLVPLCVRRGLCCAAGLHLLRRFLLPTREKASFLAVCYAAAIVVCLWTIVQFPFRLELLPVYFVAPLVPFLFAGMSLSMIFHLNPDIASTLYFADLTGASVGALAVTVLLEWFGSESTVLLIATAPLGASALLSKRYRTTALFGAFIVVALAVSNERTLLFRVTPGALKAMHRHM